MVKFADSIGGLPDNFCAMTTVTSAAPLSRVDGLRDVDCLTRGLSIEPLWSPVANELDLSGIDWFIAGAESGVGPQPKSIRSSGAKPFTLSAKKPTWPISMSNLVAIQRIAVCRSSYDIPMSEIGTNGSQHSAFVDSQGTSQATEIQSSSA